MSGPSEHHLGEDLASFASGRADLSAARRAELDAHVASCESCKRAIAETKMVFEALDLAPVATPSASFDRALFARLDDVDRKLAEEDRASFWARVRAFLSPPRVAVAGVAMAVLALVVVAPGTGPAPQHTETALLEGSDEIEVAENLELLRDFEVVDNLDVIEDLDLLAEMDEEEPG